MRVVLPWRVQNFFQTTSARLHFSANRLRHLGRSRPAGLKRRLLFSVPPYGYTGGAYAVVSVANLLATDCDVDFLTTPTNTMNRFMSANLRMVTTLEKNYDLAIIDGSETIARLEQLQRRGAKVVMTMHGDPPGADGLRNYGGSDEHLQAVMDTVDGAHYISPTQEPFFRRRPALHRFRIPNYVNRITDKVSRPAVGIVGDTTLPRKNVPKALAAAETSAAPRIEIWGRNQGQRSSDRVRWNGFCTDRRRIYESFSVLLHLSLMETQPLVILEAMSAGITCVLADLPNYAPWQGLPGIWIVDPDDSRMVAAAIDAALAAPDEVRAGLVAYWREHYSPDAIRATWLHEIDRLLSGHGTAPTCP